MLAEPGWADYLIDALAAPAVAWLLLLIGGAALYAELQAPGIGVGGFVAGVCFLLYFWSKHLDGTAGWLEVLLFAGGRVLHPARDVRPAGRGDLWPGRRIADHRLAGAGQPDLRAAAQRLSTRAACAIRCWA